MPRTTQPANKNFFDSSRFKFRIEKLPNVNFLVQTANIPSLVLGTVKRSTAFVDIRLPGDELSWNELNVTVKLDEGFQVWREIFAWMVALGAPDNFDQYKDLLESSNFAGDSPGVRNLYSDASMSVMTNHFNPNFEFVYVDCYPIQLGEILMSSISGDVEFPTVNVTFAYQRYYIRERGVITV